MENVRNLLNKVEKYLKNIEQDKLSNTENLLRNIETYRIAREDAKALFEDQLAPEFNLFSFFIINEITISKCLAFLLNANEAHGQKDLFIKEFYKKFNIPEKVQITSKNYKVHKEFSITNKRRLDILLTDNKRYIAIENKPWACDKHNQLKDYGTWLHQEAKNNDSWLLIYLCNNIYTNSSLPENTEEHIKQNILHITFRELLDCLVHCSLYIKALNIKLFVEQFIKYIQESINYESDMTEQNEIKDKLMGNVKEALLIEKNIRALKEALFAKFITHINTQIEYLNIKIEANLDIEKRYYGFYVNFEKNDRFQLRWEFSRENCRELYYGIKRVSQYIKKDEELYQNIKKVFSKFTKGNIKIGDSWPVYVYAHENGMPWGMYESEWLSFKTPETSEFAKKVISIIKTVYENKELLSLLK